VHFLSTVQAVSGRRADNKAVLLIWLGVVALVIAVVWGITPSLLHKSVETEKPEETVLADTPIPAIQAQPTIASTPPVDSIDIEMSLPRGDPTLIEIANTSGVTIISVNLIPAYLDSNDWLKPDRRGVAGWYAQDGWSDHKPGFPGPSVIVGHVSWNGAPDVFINLKEVQVGDIITVSYSSGDAIMFEVKESDKRPKNLAVDTSTDFGKRTWTMQDSQATYLTVFTCDDDSTFTDGSYEGNWYVYAELVQ